MRMEEGYGREVFKSEGGERAVVVEEGFRVRRVVGVERMEVRGKGGEEEGSGDWGGWGGIFERGGRSGKSEADTWGVEV